MKKRLVLSALGCFAMFAQHITSFEPTEKRINGGGAYTQFVQEHATDGDFSAKVFYPGSDKDTWPDMNLYLDPKIFPDTENDSFFFDVWHAEKGNLTLNIRIDYNVGESAFGGVQALPKTKNTCDVKFDKSVFKGVKRVPKKLVIYRRMPRENATVWIDNVRLGKKTYNFKPIFYVAPAGKREATASEKQAGFQLFQRNWMELVFKNVAPQPTDKADVVLSATACPGEVEPMTLSIHPLKSFSKVTLTIDEPLKNDSGDTLPTSAFNVMNILCINKRPAYPMQSYYADVPMVIDRTNTIKLDAGETKSFWIDVTVPENTKGGIYNGFATLTLDGAQHKVPIAFKVRSFKVPEAGDKMFGEYLTMPKVDESEYKQVITEEFAFMRRLGMTSVGICYGPATDEKKFENGKCTLKIKENAPFTYAMDAYVKEGYTQPVILLSDSGQGFASDSHADLHSDTYKAYYKAYWTAMQEACKRRGWPELIVQPEDEPAWREASAKERHKTLLTYLKEIPGQRTEQDGPGDSYFINEAGPYSDVWNFNGRVGDKPLMERLAKEGKKAVFYNCDVESYRTATSRYMAGFFQLVSGADGCYNWALKSYAGDVFDDLDSKNGDTTNFFPGDKKHAGGPGIGLLAFREGIDDYNYAAYLKKLIAQHPGKKADYAQKVLDSILASIKYDPHLRDTADFPKLPNDANGNARITGRCNIKNGWELEDYSLAREIIAGQIEILLAEDKDTALAKPVALKAQKKVAQEDNSLAETTAANSYSVQIPQVVTAPKIDGVLDDSCWMQAGVMKDFSINVGGKPLAQTIARVVSDGEYLYFGVECMEEYVNSIAANVTQNQGEVYMDDCIELFIDPAHNNANYKQICVNVLGYYSTHTGDGKSWKPTNIKTAGSRGKDRWFLEVGIPMAELQLKGKTFGLNVCRERRPIEVFELSCWSPTNGSFGQPAFFGVGNLGMAWFRSISADDVVVGKSGITVSLVNQYQNDDALTVEANWKLTQNGKQVATGTSSTKVKPGKQEAKAFIPLTVGMPGNLEALVTIKSQDGKLLEKQTVRTIVPPIVEFKCATPFAGENWSTDIKVNYNDLKDEKLRLQVFADSNPKAIVSIDIDDTKELTLTPANGKFTTLDKLNAKLVYKSSGKVIGEAKLSVFAK